jgi:hypothetical protein
MQYVKQFRAKKKNTGEEVLLEVYAASADTSTSAMTAVNADSIGNVEKYSEYDGEKYHEGLTFINGAQRGVVELNDKGNLAVESLSKHLNLESAKGIQMKPTTNIILDSTRRIVKNNGNEIHIEAKFDDFGKVSGFDGDDEQWAELKLHSRNLDLRCHDHGGIALQIAGHDGRGNENKIKFESDRTTQIGATKNYSGEGGKGLEFGTFNNEHASLFCGDYRFKKDAQVYAVTRETPTQTSTGKIDYPTQADDFKDVINAATPSATWDEIIGAAKKCANLDETIRAEVARQALSGEVDTSVFVTKSDVEGVVASAISEAHIDLTGVATEAWVLDQNYIDALPDGVQYIKMGKSKGNFAVDVTGKYTWELTSPKSATTVDEYGDIHEKGDRVIKYSNEAFYTDTNKVYYKAGMEAKLADNVTVVPADTIVYNQACNLTFDVPEGAYQYFPCTSADTSFYEDPTKFAYKCLIKDSLDFEGTPRPKKYMVDGAGLSESAITYYDSKATVYDEDGVTVLVPGQWERVDVWKKSTLWSQNEININLETDSKIKFAGKKIETVWTIDDVDYKMDDILLSTNTLSTDANEVVFEQKISKNGDRSGQDTEIVYSFGNNVADTEKVPDFAAFKANYNGKHTPKTDEELQSMYDAFLAEGQSFEVRVKISELLGLVARVEELEARVRDLETNN